MNPGGMNPGGMNPGGMNPGGMKKGGTAYPTPQYPTPLHPTPLYLTPLIVSRSCSFWSALRNRLRRNQIRFGKQLLLIPLRLADALDLQGDRVDGLLQSLHASVLLGR